jgi:hypothetical protein
LIDWIYDDQERNRRENQMRLGLMLKSIAQYEQNLISITTLADDLHSLVEALNDPMIISEEWLGAFQNAQLDLETVSASLLGAGANTPLPEDAEDIRRAIEVIRNLVAPMIQGV